MRAKVAGMAGLATIGAVAVVLARERRAAAQWEEAVRHAGPEVDLRGERVRPSGRVRSSRTPLVVYSVRDWELLRTSMPGVSLEQIGLGRRGGRVELGDHPVADAVRALDLSSGPFATTNILTCRFLIPAGHVIGSARPYIGYAGVERDFGRYTVSHAGTPPIDQYAHRDPVEWWVLPEAGGTGAAPPRKPVAVMG